MSNNGQPNLDSHTAGSNPAALEQPCVVVRNVSASYGAKTALRNITLEIPSRQIVGIIGSNGAGKSTLLKAMIGQVQFDSGSIRIFGAGIGESKNRIAYVPQKEMIDWNFPVSVMDVVLMGRFGRIGLFRRPGKQDRLIAVNALERMGMAGASNTHIRELSGGQQQRVFLARALAQEADLLLLDEPFVGVDAATEQSIFILMKELREEGRTLIVVNHDLSMVRQYDRLIMINQRLVAHGPVDEVFQPANLHATYGGRLTILDKTDQLRV